ncbi:MAG TPA: hypothetical protein VHH91_06645 [Vicinamibacterales bacterium]|nr:hypothetical protein [Vicinamibacterales bacterium]
MTSPPVGRLVRERSVPGFYALAACAMWLLALGPTGRFMGARIWYKAPYAWLMMVPGSDAIRVPARFWMLVVLCLAVVVAYGVSKLRSRPPTVAWTLSALLYAGLVAEAWIAALPLPAPPAPVAALESSSRHVPVLEVPLGSYERDLGAMYRQMSHERPLVNGYSAYEPRSFTSLRVGLDSGDAAALRPYSERTALDILVHTGVDKSGAYDEVVRKAGAVLVTSGTRFRLYHLAQQPPLVEPPPSAPARLARITDKQRGDVTAPLTSDAPLSWVNVSSLDVELAARCTADEVALDAQPGLIHAAVQGSSSEGRSDLWSGSVGERSVRGALAHPAWPRLRLRFAPTPVERLRIDLRVPRGKPPVALDVVRVFGEGCR